MLNETILGYKASWRILSLLLETPIKPVSRKELFEHTRLGNAPLSQGLNRLVKARILIKRKTGRKEFYYVNLDNDCVKSIKELWEKEKKDLRALDYDIKVILSEFLRGILDTIFVEEVILFGSYAKGTDSLKSDIDLAVIFEKDLSKELEVAKVVKTLEKKFNKQIQIHYFTEKSFNKKNKLIDEIKRDGILLMN